MTRPTPAGVAAILLDIEGTTTPIAFVYQKLFPYARDRVQDYLTRHRSSPEGLALFRSLRAEHEADRLQHADAPPWNDSPDGARVESAVAYVRWLMDRDRKSTALKELQGRIWEEGYRAGELAGEVFPDVAPALERWRGNGIRVGIFSSGSVLAQQLLFRHSNAGDLTRHLDSHFDTQLGPKSSPDSYRRIAATMGVAPQDVLFVSDVLAELDAARASGMQVVLAVRPGNASVGRDHSYRTIGTFDELTT